MRDPARRKRKPTHQQRLKQLTTLEVEAPQDRTSDPIVQMAKEDQRARHALKMVKRVRAAIWRLEEESKLRRAQARRQMIAIAHDLLPKAAGLARKGRPRLLAICAKIIGDEKLVASEVFADARPATEDES